MANHLSWTVPTRQTTKCLETSSQTSKQTTQEKAMHQQLYSVQLQVITHPQMISNMFTRDPAGASNGPDRTSDSMGTTGQPAVVYLPGGTYLMTGSLQLYVGTVLIGDPLNPPVLKAAQDFRNDHIIYAKDPHHDGTINFYIAVKNIVVDSTSVDKSRSITLIDWTVSQATQITNVVFSKQILSMFSRNF